MNIRLSEKALARISAFAVKLTTVLVDRSIIYAKAADRVTVKPEDIQAAVRPDIILYRAGGKDKHGVTIERLMSCPNLTPEQKGKKAKLSREYRKTQKEKSPAKRKRGGPAPPSEALSGALSVTVSDIGCITLQKTSFRNFVYDIMLRQGTSSVKLESGERKTIRWSKDALHDLQVVVETQVILFAGLAAKFSQNAKQRTILSKDVVAAEQVGRMTKRIRID